MSDRICEDCGNICDEGELKIVVERHSELDDSFPEMYAVCPCCGSGRIVEAAQCWHCFGSFHPDKLRGGYYCDDCMEMFLTTPYAVGFCKEYYDEFAEFVQEKEECKCSSVKDTSCSRVAPR